MLLRASENKTLRGYIGQSDYWTDTFSRDGARLWASLRCDAAFVSLSLS
jgi:hypothetical protein